MWDTEDSLIGTNPGVKIRICPKLFLFISELFLTNETLSGMGYRPHPPDAKIESTLIWYRSDKSNNESVELGNQQESTMI